MAQELPLSVIRLFRDGSCTWALLGPNIIESEVGFAAIEAPGSKEDVMRAAEIAAVMLETCLGIVHLKLQRVWDQEAEWRCEKPGKSDDSGEVDDVGDNQWWRHC